MRQAIFLSESPAKSDSFLPSVAKKKREKILNILIEKTQKNQKENKATPHPHLAPDGGNVLVEQPHISRDEIVQGALELAEPLV